MIKVYCVNLQYKLLFVFLKESSQRVNTGKVIYCDNGDPE